MTWRRDNQSQSEHGSPRSLLLTAFAILSIFGHWTACAEAQSNQTDDRSEQAIVDADETIWTQPEYDESQEIEEVQVTGWRLSTLKEQVIQAENNVYDIFNKLNEDDGYDIICHKETRVGSQIVHRVCKARAYREAVAEASQDQIDELEESGMGHFDIDLNERYSNKGLQQRMLALARENPELLAALKERLAAQRAYEAEREKKYK